MKEKKDLKTYRIIYWDELQDKDMWIEIEAPSEKIAVSRIRGRQVLKIKEVK